MARIVKIKLATANLLAPAGTVVEPAIGMLGDWPIKGPFTVGGAPAVMGTPGMPVIGCGLVAETGEVATPNRVPQW
jgi:hypothetical protein